ncbi:hypothetical protein INR49_006685, partial [Caranx melampygus]
MGLLWMMMMMMFLVHVEAEKMTEVKVKVGDNVTLTCSDNTSNMYWYVQIHGNIRGFIGRTFSGRQEPSYCSPSSMSKYQLREDTLVITNTTAEDCRLYTCAKKVNSVIVDMSTFHLVSDVPSLLSCNDSQTAQHWTTWLSDYVIYGSLTLNAVFILVTTGVLQLQHTVSARVLRQVQLVLLLQARGDEAAAQEVVAPPEGGGRLLGSGERDEQVGLEA